MKRTIILSSLMILLILTMIGSVIFLNNPELLQPKKSERNPESDNLEYAYCAVIKNDIVHRYNTTGQVISGAPSVYIDDVTVQIGDPERYTVAVAKGDEVVPGQLLCTVDGKDYVSDIEAKVVAVDLHDESGTQLTISLLNYGKLVILASVDYGILDQIDYETPVDLTINGVVCQSFFSDIGYEIRGGTVDVVIPVPCKCLPGTKVDISVVTERVSGGLSLPSDFVENDGERYSVLLKKGDSLERVPIVVGAVFEAEDGIRYYEILSGLTKNDVAAVEVFPE